MPEANMAAYALVMLLDAETHIRTGSLGVIRYPRGCYVYVGSAMRGMASWVSRHMRRDKPLLWHVDYLTQHTQTMAALCDVAVSARECEWAGLLGCVEGAQVFPSGFGSSDCRCPGHLIYFPQRPPIAKLVHALYA